MQIWRHVTDLNTQQQAAAICMTLKGRAQHSVKQISPHEVQQGSIIGGIQPDPVSYILTVLAIQFKLVNIESKVNAMAQLLAFGKLPKEDTRTLLTRCKAVSQCVCQECNFTFTFDGTSLQPIKVRRIGTDQLIAQTIPNTGYFLTNEQEFTAMKNQLKQMFHISGSSPGNHGSQYHEQKAQTKRTFPSTTS